MGFLWSWWTLWAGAALLWALTQKASADRSNTGGQEFLTAFMQNDQPRLNENRAHLNLLLSSLSNSTASVSILSQADGTSQDVTVKPGQSVMVNISTKAEMIGSDVFQHAVVVKSDRTISVQAINTKPNTGEVTLLRPVWALGTEYFVFTTSSNSTMNVKEFAVVAGASGASINVQLKGTVTFQGKIYPVGSVLSVTLKPYQVAQVQSEADLSGSKVTASSPVAVLSGHTCASKFTSCSHVVEQLLPTSAWGTRYVVPPLASQVRFDLAYVVASQATKLTYHHGNISSVRGLQEGDVIEFEVRPSQPLYLSADVGIQVLLFGAGGNRNDLTYDAYLVLIPDVAAYCSAYVVSTIPDSEAVAVMVAPTKAADELTMDGRRIGARLPWVEVPGSEFSYAEVDLNTTDLIHVNMATADFALLSLGLVQSGGYGTAAACIQTQGSAEKPSCQGVRCAPSKLCQVVDGQARCVPRSVATCRAQGDPHYTTFDGRRYDMMGTCSYTMAELNSDDQTLPAFSVEAKNEHRGSRRVSYVGSVTVRAYSHSVSLARGEVGFARIDNQRLRLPVSLANGRLSVYQSGMRAIVELDFGLVVIYDWDCRLALSLPARFQNQVYGLCGNYNGNSTDDFLTPDGEQAPNVEEFASSWKLDDGDYQCEDGCQSNCPSCTSSQAQHYQGDRLCGMLTNPSGPFAACHDALDPRPFLEDCVYDLCVVNGDRSSLCRGLSAYAQACLELGISIEDWRSPSNCPLSCPANSRYERCSPACPASCNPSAAPANCSERPCVEGCTCLPGFVASGGACVPASSCGCIYEGRPLAPGQQVWADDQCQRRCTCDGATHQVSCSDTQGCPTGEHCLVQNGLLGCYPERFGSCQASGDPHYVTFDGRRFDFMGTCTYLLTGLCGQNRTLPSFRVLVENEHRGSAAVSYTRAVRVEARGVTVAVRREHPGQVLVDGILQYLPFQAADGQVQVFRQGRNAVVRTDFGLTVTYDWNARVIAKVPGSYAGALCGLCGNFNDRPEDDLALQGGGQAANALAFGNSWQEETRPGCGAAEPGDCPKLDSLVAQQLQSKKECGVLADPAGPFRECHRKLDPQGAVRDCVYDLCLLPGQSGPLCDALAAYADACQAAGATVHPWRSEDLCPLTCPPHSHYEACSYGCPLSCGDLPVPGGCGSDCREDCVCDEGFVLSGESCVPLPSCGCVYEGTYYPPGQTFYPGSGCKSLCHCQEGGLVSCEPSICGPHEACQLSGGVLGCVAVGPVTCHASGDPHYTTFDGRRYDMMGTCSYTMAELNSDDQTLPAFSVEAKNEHRGSRRVSYVGSVTVRAYSHSVSLARGEVGFARIDNQRSRLPVSLANGRLSVYQSGMRAVVELDFGLVVIYDWDCRLALSLPARFQNQVYGLCGNYNGNSTDDFLTPDGEQAPNVEEFASSWKLDDGDYLCEDGCQSNCPSCTPGQAQHYQGDRLCGMLTKPSGPFAACHDALDPRPFLEDCVYDLCVVNGDRSSLCRGLSAYAQACLELGISIEDWRSPSDCPLSCPANSRYERCSPACPASCNPSAAPANCSERPCVEGCTCLPGFVASGGACVPASSCGCIYEGRPLAPGQQVWADDQCQRRCTCDGATHQVSCSDTQGCPTGEHCLVQNGLLGCYPERFGSCQASGDPHYVTFDGRRFDFMGTCTYLLTGSCGQNRTLPSFRVLVENEHRGSAAVSYTRAVRVEARGVTVAVRREHPGQVLVDGILQYLPFQAADGQVQVFRQGRNAVVRTDFGLTVTYDWNARVIAKVPGSYAGALCGLCGNFNDRPEDDLALQGGGQAANALAFGNSWQEETRPGCGAAEPGDCPKLDSLVAQQLQSKKECGVLADPAGPFRECHRKLDPQGAVRDCVYDLCLLPGQSGPLCDALAAYADACQAAGATVHPWRSEDLCPLTCPPHSHYEACSYGCPLSCGDLPVPGGCGSDCREDCVCDEGFVLSGESCVPLPSCGCVYEGTYYPPGQTFYPGSGCKSLCHCQEGGLVSCEPSTCGPHEACQLSGGVLGCVAVGSVTCQASGDPHYTTFDGRRFDFMGTCVYVLAQTCGTRPGLEQFTVLQENVEWNNMKVSVTRVVTVQVANFTLQLEQNKWKVTVNGMDRKPPVVLAQGRVRAFREGSDMVIQTDFGLRVVYDLVYNVRVAVPGNYYKQLCGLCGDYNGDPKDDFRKPNGSQACSPNEFGNSWEAAVPGSPCLPPPTCKPGEDCHPQQCGPELQEKYQQEQFCGLLASSTGPLAACHELLNPQGPLQDCVFDLCVGGGNQSILCDNIHAYVSACQAAGGHVESWRTESFCPMQCAPNSHYELCADTCTLTCSALSAAPQCPDACAEGCQCDAGFLSDGQACVPIQKCGCYHDGIYYEPEQTVLVDNCQQQCVCQAGKGLVCQNHTCEPGHVCLSTAGVLSCVKEPCFGVTCGPQETCQEKNGQGVCVPNYEATCLLWGDPHYRSFDGRNFDFQGTCNYVLATTSCPGLNNTQGLTPFTVTTKNENRGNPAVSYARLVTVTTLDTNISIHKGEVGKVRVNGVLTALPVSVAGGRLTVTQGSSKAMLATDFGLRVSYDWKWRVEVTLPSSYHGAVCGLCGNMDRNPSNEQAFPNGTLAPSIPIWGGSWRAPGWDPLCWDECHGSCPTCPENQLEKYKGPGFCGPLAAGAGGPFAACHAHVAPDSFFKGCVLDVCLGGGAHDILCQALATYAAACQAAGIVIEDWRAQAGCEVSCPKNSHYELCGPPCPASCPAPAPSVSPAPCEGPCAEGCQCDSGFVLSADRCVPLDGGCGCWANNTYHEAGSEFWASATCSQRCQCGPGGGSLVCKPASCGLGEVCSLLPSGQYGCQPVRTAQCQAWGDPHYITLDGRRFDFQGTCEYLLSAPCSELPAGVENFTVTVANEHRGSQAVSYTRSVSLHIYNLNLTLSARWPRRLQVDGELVALPFQPDSRLHAYLSGPDVVVTVATGLSLAFDGNSNVRLRLPAAFAGSLCGLCGNYNQDPADDLQAVGGNPGRWQVGGAEGCGECVPGPCPSPCTAEQQEPFGGPDACGVISAPDGPLAPCHRLLRPTQYFQACLLDACQAQGHPGGLCPAVAAYVAACQAAGAQLGEWRRPDFCPFQCPAHSHYKLCGDSCPVSCPSLSEPEGCESACREGCVCDAGFVLSGDTCVPLSQCGCLHEGRYYPLGEAFYPGPECERRCECGPGGQVICQEGTACQPHEECRIQDGVQACHPKGCGHCLASGGLHYVTLDGRVYDMRGSCSYILARVCHPQPGDQDFAIVLENNAAGEAQRLIVSVAGQVVGLAPGPRVTVDGEAVALPVAVGHVRVTAEGRNLILQTTKGLRLLFDGDAYILISIPGSFRGRLCGLCGNFNGNWTDDFVLPCGTVAPSVDAFAAAWRVPGSSQGCGEGFGPQGWPVCLAEETAPYESAKACGQLQDPQGPFAACHAVLSPSEYFRQCVFDLCVQKGNSSFLCRSLAAYTAACQAAGQDVKPWRTNSFCPLQCPANSHYSVCTRSCQGACAALSGLTGCTSRCFEGCECDDHFLLSQGVCIPVQDCGCTHDGRYLPVNSSLLSSDCNERCSCSSSTGLTCQEMGCPLGHVCEVEAGTRNCWVPAGICSLSGSTNLTTFDGAHSAVSIPGVYELSLRCPGIQNIPWYRVLADVHSCRGKGEAVKQAHIFFQDGLVTLTPNRGVWVNGLQVDLPAEVLTSVSVSQNRDGTLLVQQKAGVRVQLSSDGQLVVMVSSDHAGILCGACGNFDGDETNDGHDSQGNTAVEHWQAQDFSPCNN